MAWHVGRCRWWDLWDSIWHHQSSAQPKAIQFNPKPNLVQNWEENLKWINLVGKTQEVDIKFIRYLNHLHGTYATSRIIDLAPVRELAYEQTNLGK